MDHDLKNSLFTTLSRTLGIPKYLLEPSGFGMAPFVQVGVDNFHHQIITHAGRTIKDGTEFGVIQN
ncbi:hypothetical protein GCM10028868_36950 [Virgibacillus kimchii]